MERLMLIPRGHIGLVPADEWQDVRVYIDEKLRGPAGNCLSITSTRATGKEDLNRRETVYEAVGPT